jgi:hypothetical protein
MSQITIRYNGVNITNRVLFESARFTSQMAAQPGMFEITCKDPNRTDSYVTGKEVTLEVDGALMFGGYVTQVSRTFALPADLVPSDARLWVLRGIDYNILFDKRVVRNPMKYVESPEITTLSTEGELVKTLTTYLDIPAGFNVTSEVDDIRQWHATRHVFQAGGTWRDEMDMIRQFSGALYYMTPTKHLRYVALEDTFSPWGFSDTPNGTSTIGPRDVSATEDAAAMINDALIWGGSELAGSEELTSEEGGKVVFWREQNATSISNHGRWQLGETHFGEDGYKLDPIEHPTTSGVRIRANRIVNGPMGDNTGMKDPQWQIKLTWYGRKVPSNNHLWPGQLVNIALSTMGSPLTPMVLPLRSVDVSFPAKNDSPGEADVMFTGSFGLQHSDPWQLWALLRGGARLRRRAQATLSTFNDQAESTTYGGLGQFTAVPVPDGSITNFSLPVGGYIAGTLQVYLDGRLLPSLGYTSAQISPANGTFSITPAPQAGSWVHVVCRTT